MTQIVGNVIDVGFGPLDGKLRVWAWFRPEEVGLIAPYRREWEITGGEIEAGVDVIPGPAAVEIDCGPNAYTTVDVMVPDAAVVTIQDLFEQVYSYTPGVVSEAWEARRGAEAAAESAEDSAGVALGAEQGALAAESGAALSAATLSARVEQSGQDILFTSDGKPYFADPSQIENVPLTVDTSVGTRVMLGNQMIYGDTGWRDVTALLSEAPDNDGQVRIRRTTNHLDIVVNGVHWPTPGTRILEGLGSHWGTFHSSYPLVAHQLAGASSVARGSVAAAWNGEHRITQHEAVPWIYLTVTVPDQKMPWPTSLPGTPA